MIRRTILVGLISVPIAGYAHHSVSGLYEDIVVELQGEVTSVLWRNPHVGFTMSVRDENGDAQEWDMAMTALSNLRRWQIPRDFLVVGETIRVAGKPSKRGGNAMYISNALRPNGEEILLLANATPRWSDRTVEMSESRRAGIGDPSEPERGIFRVWSRPPGVSNPFSPSPELNAYLTDNTLVVETTNTNWRHFNTRGIPLSPAVVLVERFTMRPDGSRMDWEMTVADVEIFTEPVVLNAHWVWYPDAEVGTYDCLLAAEDQ